jgi:hypothetical protein
MTRGGRQGGKGGGHLCLKAARTSPSARVRACVGVSNASCYEIEMTSITGSDHPAPSMLGEAHTRITQTQKLRTNQAPETAQLCVCILRMCAARLCCQVHHGRTNHADHTPATVHLSSPTTMSRCLGSMADHSPSGGMTDETCADHGSCDGRIVTSRAHTYLLILYLFIHFPWRRNWHGLIRLSVPCPQMAQRTISPPHLSASHAYCVSQVAN